MRHFADIDIPTASFLNVGQLVHCKHYTTEFQLCRPYSVCILTYCILRARQYWILELLSEDKGKDTESRLVTSDALQSRKWQLIGTNYRPNGTAAHYAAAHCQRYGS